MSFLEKAKFMWDSCGMIVGMIDCLDLSSCNSEKEAEDALYEYLHRELSVIQIIRQYGRGRSRVDLMIGDKIMVEIKYGFSSTGEYQRLVGQIMDYLGWGRNLVIVVVGLKDPALIKDLKTFIAEQNSGISSFAFGDDRITLIEK